MIYLDNAATTMIKPLAVSRAVMKAMQTMASPGRGGHEPAMRAAKTVFECRMEAAELFHVPSPEQIVFTLNATHGLNIAINSLARKGSKVLVSGYEHNSVTRPLAALGAEIHVAQAPLFDSAAMLAAFEKQLPGMQLAVCTHVSNVFGYILPIYDIARLCREQGVPLIVDASQSAGILAVDYEQLGAAFIAMPGHKGLFGPQGTGILIVCTDRLGEALIQGGTGSLSAELEQPQLLPDRFESGTPNVPGIAGLCAGLSFLQYVGVDQVGAHEQALAQTLIEGLRSINSLTVFHADDPACQSGVISVRSDKLGAEALAARLSEAGVCTRAGLHCAPTAHETAGTLDTGTVRLSISWFNTREEILDTVSIFQKIMTNL